MQQKKILVMVDWFAPGYKAGGPIRSCVNFALLMKDDFAVSVLTTDTDHGEQQPYPGIQPDTWTNAFDPAIPVFYAKKKGLSRQRLKQVMLDADADVVYLNHLFSPYFVLYPLWLKLTGRLKSRIVLSPRGALYDSALSVKPVKKKPFLKIFLLLGIHKKITFHATNAREKQAVLHHFPGSSVVIADNLPNARQPAQAFLEKIPGSLSCIFIARIVPIKNLDFLLDVCMQVSSNLTLTIIGPVEDKMYWETCQQKIEALPQNIRVHYLGAKSNDALMPILQQHHLFILPTAGENFGHSIFESLLAGRPVLISDQTPWLGLAQKRAGWDIPLTRPERFVQTIEEAAAWDQQQFDEWAAGAWKYAFDFIRTPEIKRAYLQLFS